MVQCSTLLMRNYQRFALSILSYIISEGNYLLSNLAPAFLESLTDIKSISNLEFVNPNLCKTQRSAVKFASARLDQQYEVLQKRAHFNCN